MGEKTCNDIRDFTFNDNKNINYIVVRNISQDEVINIKDYIPLIENSNISETYSSNVNINIIFIQNIITYENIQPTVKIDSIPKEEVDQNLIEQICNNNINFVVIKNVIPLKGFKYET